MKNILKAYITFLFILIWKNSFSQINTSARASGMSGTCLTLADVLSTHQNPAQNISGESISTAINASRYFNIAELNSITGSVLYPINKKHAAAFHLFRIGSKDFYDQEFALSYGLILSQKIKIGIQLERKSKFYQQETQISISCWTSTIGLSSMPLPWLQLGASVSNPDSPKWNNQQRTILPGIIRIGTRVNFSKNTQLYSQFNKTKSLPGSFHTGLEYSPAPLLQFRTGVSTNPFKQSFGFSVIKKNTRIDFALVNHYPLGMSPGIGIQHKFQR
ncbi:MAG TPA: hypothetical protein PKJ62_05600 [Bacteroidia bacterium]|nr:hypothetical protein [Bacteroidia bacterium]HNS12321.1 hypothetical protein [Bacteroidia bacterium]